MHGFLAEPAEMADLWCVFLLNGYLAGWPLRNAIGLLFAADQYGGYPDAHRQRDCRILLVLHFAAKVARCGSGEYGVNKRTQMKGCE